MVGLYGVVAVGVDLFATALSFGFNQAIIRYGPTQRILRAVATLTILQLVAFFVLGVSGLAILFRVGGPGAPTMTAVAAICGFARALGILGTLAAARWENRFDFQDLARRRSFGAGFANIVSVVVLIATHSVVTLAARDVLSALAILVSLRGGLLAYRGISIRDPAARAVFRYCMPIYLLGLAERVYGRVDLMLAGKLLGRTEFGFYYQVRALIDGVSALPLSAMQSVIFAYYCRVRDAAAVFQVRSRQLLAASLMLVVAFLAIGATTSVPWKWVFSVLLGAQWAGAEIVVWPLIAQAVSALCFEHARAYSLAVRRPLIAFLARGVAVLSLVGLAVALTPWLGSLGQAEAYCIATVIAAVIANYGAHRSAESSSAEKLA